MIETRFDRPAPSIQACISPSPADWVAIQNLYAYYNLCSDTGYAEGFASCFTEDGILDQESRPILLRGRENILVYKRQEASRRNGKYRRHWNSGLLLHKTADDIVQAWCYLHAYDGTPGWLPVHQGAGVYHDTLQKVDGCWLFAERVLTMDARVEATTQLTQPGLWGKNLEKEAV
jgi:hypothetical protein